MAVLAGNLSECRREINARWPNRDHESDGWIGDAAHQAQHSDHNPDSRGIVHAIDVDVDGIDPHELVRRAIAHPTTQYVIYNRTIWSRTYGFQARAYTGSDPHTGHVHISGRYGSEFENDLSPWGLADSPAPTPPPPPAGNHAPGTRICELESPMMSGDDVKFIQRWIGPRQCGSFNANGEPDGILGPKTRDGIVWYQGMRRIKQDGQVGPQTWGQMGVRWRG